MIYLQKLASNDKIFLKKIKKIYENAFPFNERRNFKDVIALIADQRFHLSAIAFENEVVGMLSIWDFDSFVYIEHFAIDEVFRGNGLGSHVLRMMMQEESRQIVLEVELPEDEISLKRIKFYEGFGFNICHELYIQPPYDKDKESVTMFIMSRQAIASLSDFQLIRKTLHQEVYGFYE